MNLEKLNSLISKKYIEDADLSDLDLNGLDLSECTIKNVRFSKESSDKEIKNINFKNAKLQNVFFDNAKLENCDFDGANTFLEQVSFKRCTLEKCRFRNTSIAWCDFRYAEINSATFEGSKLDFCDFYRAFLVGVIIFRKSKISNCSLFYTYFDEGATIRRENLKNGQLLQQNKEAYRKFLIDWNTYGTGTRKNEQNRLSNWDPSASIKARYADAEDIYKTLNGLWMSKGYLGDANWAYVKGKKMERKRLISELTLSEKSYYEKFKDLFLIIWNYMSDAMFGYGESMRKMIFTYILMVFLFAYLYYSSSEVSLATYAKALGISFKNMVAMTPDEVSNVSPFIDFLNMIQTTVGILITGIFGFILGNKIRNQ